MNKIVDLAMGFVGLAVVVGYHGQSGGGSDWLWLVVMQCFYFFIFYFMCVCVVGCGCHNGGVAVVGCKRIL